MNCELDEYGRPPAPGMNYCWSKYDGKCMRMEKIHKVNIKKIYLEFKKDCPDYDHVTDIFIKEHAKGDGMG